MNYVTLALAFSGASALVVRQPRIPSGSTGLFRRQASVLDPDEIPSQCTSQCTPLVNDTQSCAAGDNACFCTSTVAGDFQTCLNCLSGVLGDNPSFGPAVQSAATVFNMGCSQAGISVPSLTLEAPGAPGPTGTSGNGSASASVPTPGPSGSVTLPPGSTLSIPPGGTTISGGTGGTTISSGAAPSGVASGSAASPSDVVTAPAGNSSVPNATGSTNSSSPSSAAPASGSSPAAHSSAGRLQAGFSTAVIASVALVFFCI